MLSQPLRSNGIAAFGGFSQSEESLVGTRDHASPGDFENLFGGEVGRLQPGGGFSESAVATPVAAELGEGDEDLGGEGDSRAGLVSPDAPCLPGEIVDGRLGGDRDHWPSPWAAAGSMSHTSRSGSS